MPHPYQFSLQEYQIAINKLVPSVPEEIRREAQKMHDELLANESATQEEIRAALVKTGKAEYPHRHAFEEMTSRLGEEKFRKEVLEALPDELRVKVEEILNSGVKIAEIVKSRMFETFAPEERFKIQEAILKAKTSLGEELNEVIKQNPVDYDEAVDKYQRQSETIQAEIDKLRALADKEEMKDERWKDEIKNLADDFEQGWSVTERDPVLETVTKEIENWLGRFGEL